MGRKRWGPGQPSTDCEGGGGCLPDVSDALGRRWSRRKRLSKKFDLAVQIQAELENPDGRSESSHTDTETRGRFFCSKNRTSACYCVIEAFLKRPFFTLLKI